MTPTFSTYASRFILALLSLSLGLGAALAEEPHIATKDEYVFLLMARGNPYWTTVAKGIEEAAAEQKVKATVYFTSSDSGTEEQLNTCLTAVQRRPKLIALVALNTAVGIQCLKQAASAGIAVAELDSSIPLDEAERAGLKLRYSVGADNFQIGSQAADFLKTLATDDAPKVFILEGAPGSIPGRNRVNGFKERFKALFPKGVVNSVSADWDRLKATSIVSDLVERSPEVQFIYAANDQMGLGAVEALRAHRSAAQPRIISVDGMPDARVAVLQGKLAATVAQLPYLLGRRAIELAINEPKEVREVTPSPVLSKSVLEAHTDPILQYVR